MIALDIFLAELRFAVRTLVRSRGFTLVAVLTLALGMGANTAFFSIVYGVLLRPLDYRDPERLVAITAERDFSGRPRPVQTNFSLPDLEEWETRARTFESIAMYAGANAAIAGDAGVEVIDVASVTRSFFSTVEGRFLIGRPLGPGDDGSPVVVISFRLWLRRFGGSSSIVGQQLIMDRQPYTIIGVVDSTFQMPNPRTDAWRPVGFARTLNPMMGRRRAGGLQPIARLKPGVSLEQARADGENIARFLSATYPNEHSGIRITATRLRDRLVADTVKPTLVVLFAAVGLVLFVACANVTNLILARNASRSREMAVRLALGACRQRLMLQSVVLSGLIAVGGALAGTVLATSIVAGFSVLKPAGIPRVDAVRVDTPVLLFAAALAIMTTLAVGLMPTFQSVDVVTALKLGSPGTTIGRQARRLRRVLVVAEVAVSVVLLVGAGLLGRSLVRLMQTDIGVTTDHVAAALIDTSFGRTLSLTEQRALIERVVQRIRTLPGVTSAGAGASMPPNLARLRFTMNRVDEAIGRPTNYLVDAVTATPGYFSTLGMRLQKGRFFTDADDNDHSQVMIMTASTARQIFGDRDPIGRTMGLPSTAPSGNAQVTVVGIIDDVKYSGLDTAADAVIYRPFAQESLSGMFIVARTAVDIASFPLTMRREIASVDPLIAIRSVDTLDGLVAGAAAQPRFRTIVLMSMAMLTIVLAGVGLYGVVAYAVAQRTAEIGIRMALGAAPADVMRIVLREGMWLAMAGVAIGLLAARALTRVVTSLLYGVRPTDLFSFVAAAVALLIVTMIASYVPARRAARLDPLVALRTE